MFSLKPSGDPADDVDVYRRVTVFVLDFLESGMRIEPRRSGDITRKSPFLLI
jgi:hypothetical protein